MQQIVKGKVDYEVLSFNCGLDSIKEIHQNPFIVFLDQQFNIQTTCDIIHQIKDYNPDIFVVLISAQDKRELLLGLLKYEVFDFLLKDLCLDYKVENVIDRIHFQLH
jgi:DNA-binding NarL/FixJ family response regulator